MKVLGGSDEMELWRKEGIGGGREGGRRAGRTSPRYFCTNSDPTTRMKLAEVALATALTSIVFPVPVE